MTSMLTFDSANEAVATYTFFSPHSNRIKLRIIVSSRYANIVTSRFDTNCNIVYYDENIKMCRHVMDSIPTGMIMMDSIPTGTVFQLTGIPVKVLNVIMTGSDGKSANVNI